MPFVRFCFLIFEDEDEAGTCCWSEFVNIDRTALEGLNCDDGIGLMFWISKVNESCCKFIDDEAKCFTSTVVSSVCVRVGSSSNESKDNK